MKRRKLISQKRIAKKNRIDNPGMKSRYARKKTYLLKLSKALGIRMFGFEINPKPWK